MSINNFKLFYAVLQYMPDPIRRESLNVGIVFHIPSMKLSSFKRIKNRGRIRSFDDEYDSDFISLAFDSLNFEFNSDVLDEYSERFENLDDESFLYESTKFYVNEFRFLPVEVISTNLKSFEKDMMDIESTYLYYDRPKGDRITTAEVRSLMKKRLDFYGLKIDNRSNSIYSDYINDDIFDFSNDHYAFKAISFDKSRLKNVVNELKIVYYDLQSRKSDIENQKVYIVVDNTMAESETNPEAANIYKEFKNKINNNFHNVYIYPLSKFAEKINNQK